MKRFRYIPLLIIIVLLPCLFLTNSCQHEGIPADQIKQICFTGEVLPIFQNSCGTSGCHDANGGEGGYVFTDYGSIMKAITPGDASKSKAYQSITSTFLLMPPDNALPLSKRTLIRLWIDQGAIETKCGPGTSNGVPVTKSAWACYGRDIEPIIINSCAIAGCHLGASQEEAMDLSSYAKVLAAIKPGNPKASKIYNAITSSPGTENFMPVEPYSALSKAAIDTIFSWIKRGGLNEECASVCDTTGSIMYASHIKPIVDLACASCHGATSPSGGINLLTTTGLQAVAKSGKLMTSLKRKGTILMPPSYALSTCEVRDFQLWINQGYN